MIINMNGVKAPETPSPVLQEKTVTPETLPTVIGADEGYDGLSQVTVNPDAQLKAENIRSGKTIFGVAGSFVGETQYTDRVPFSRLSYNGSITAGGLMFGDVLNTADYVTDLSTDNSYQYVSYLSSSGIEVSDNLKQETGAIWGPAMNPSMETYTYKTDSANYFNKKISIDVSIPAGTYTVILPYLKDNEKTIRFKFLLIPTVAYSNSATMGYPDVAQRIYFPELTAPLKIHEFEATTFYANSSVCAEITLTEPVETALTCYSASWETLKSYMQIRLSFVVLTLEVVS